MKRLRPGLFACLVCAPAVLLACQGTPDGTNVDNVQLRFAAQTDERGTCRPERVVGAYTQASGLYAIRGEADYVLSTGSTRIPFETVFRSMDDRGYSESDAVTVLNHEGPCSDLVINITIERCEFVGADKMDQTACPDFNVTGYDAFSAVNIRHADRT